VSPAFLVVFALFVVAIVSLAVTAIRWGVRRDRVANAERAGQVGPVGQVGQIGHPEPPTPPGVGRTPGKRRP